MPQSFGGNFKANHSVRFFNLGIAIEVLQPCVAWFRSKFKGKYFTRTSKPGNSCEFQGQAILKNFKAMHCVIWFKCKRQAFVSNVVWQAFHMRISMLRFSPNFRFSKPSNLFWLLSQEVLFRANFDKKHFVRPSKSMLVFIANRFVRILMHGSVSLTLLFCRRKCGGRS